MYTQSLNSSDINNWKLSRLNDTELYEAIVPGCVHTDLQNAGVIPDPFVGVNEVYVSWVAETDWVYSLVFDADQELLSHKNIFLECDGLDTIAAITLNDNEIAKTDNMFRRYRFDIGSIIKPTGNKLSVEFKSPVNTVKAKIGEDNVITPGDSIEGSPYIRKAMYQWGWDWAPKTPTSGIWKNICIAGYESAGIDDIRINQTFNEGSVSIAIDVKIEEFAQSEKSVDIILLDPECRRNNYHAKVESGLAHIDIEINNPQLWYPNGYGCQPLYDIRAELMENGVCIDYCDKQIGLRTIELIQKPDEWGRSFFFKVNGIPVFGKGADWVPADQFPSRIDAEKYEILVRDAAAANMNMLRVWGGGIYESDDFYRYCDQYGILVWQDFAFACGHYPVDSEYLANVRQEAKDNIRRIRHHASLALWCGNNEMEWFLAGNWGGDKNEIMRKEYLEIYYKLLPEVHAAEDPTTPYWPASPASSEPFVDPNGENEGDGHYWEVWHGRLPFTAYRRHYFRFMSEFGFESLPAYSTIKSFAEPEDMNMTSLVMENHQKNSAGNGLILFYMAQTFQFPKDFKSMVYVSQLLQAEAMRYGVEHWRRNRNGFRCMGTLYWQYNDCWPVASWASIDYFNRWKALQYFAKRFYSPILLSAEEDANSVKLHVTNDTTEAFNGLLKWQLETMDGTIVKSADVEINAPAECSIKAADLDFSEYLDYDTRRQTVLVHELHSKGECLSMGVTTFAPSKHLDLLDAEVSAAVEKIDDEVRISLESNKLVRYVMLEADGCDLLFSDNFFDLPAGRKVIVAADAKGMSADEISSRLRITHLKESY